MKGGENVEIKITGADEAIKDLARAKELIDELDRIFYKLRRISFAPIEYEQNTNDEQE